MARDIFLNALAFTLLQAGLGALLSVAIGLVAAPGYGTLKKTKKWVKSFLIFPQMVSSVFSVLSLLCFFKVFPFGLLGVLLGNVFINAGICILILGEKWQAIESDWRKLSQFMGAKSFFYFKNVILPFLWPSLKSCFAIVFTFCLSSLLVPLVLGGGPQATTLELLIFERIKTDSDVKGAAIITAIQLLILLVSYAFLLKALNVNKPKIKTMYSSPKSSLWTWITLLITAILVAPYGYLIDTAAKARVSEVLNSEFFQCLANSLLIATFSALVTVTLLFLWMAKGAKQKFTYIPAISDVMLGLIGFMLVGTNVTQSSIVIILILTLFHFAAFFLPVLRFVYEPLNELYLKYNPILKTTGASNFLSIKKIYFPLAKNIFFFAFLIAFCWSLGEFTISAMVTTGPKTFPVFIEGLIGQYRLEEAAFGSLVFFVVGYLASTIGESFFDGKA